MDERRLMDMRNREFTKYGSPEKLLRDVGFLFEDLDRIPFLSGYPASHQWKVLYAAPTSISDKLTIENFMEGLRELDLINSRSPNLFKNFRSSIKVDHITPGYPDYSSPLMRVSVGNGGSSCYNLMVYGPHDQTRARVINDEGYVAKTSRDLPTIAQVMDAHIGPL